MMPNAITILFNLLEKRGVYNYKPWHAYLVTIIAFAIIAITSIRANRRRKEKIHQKVSKATNE